MKIIHGAAELQSKGATVQMFLRKTKFQTVIRKQHIRESVDQWTGDRDIRKEKKE